MKARDQMTDGISLQSDGGRDPRFSFCLLNVIKHIVSFEAGFQILAKKYIAIAYCYCKSRKNILLLRNILQIYCKLYFDQNVRLRILKCPEKGHFGHN